MEKHNAHPDITDPAKEFEKMARERLVGKPAVLHPGNTCHLNCFDVLSEKDKEQKE